MQFGVLRVTIWFIGAREVLLFSRFLVIAVREFVDLALLSWRSWESKHLGVSVPKDDLKFEPRAFAYAPSLVIRTPPSRNSVLLLRQGFADFIRLSHELPHRRRGLAGRAAASVYQRD